MYYLCLFSSATFTLKLYTLDLYKSPVFLSFHSKFNRAVIFDGGSFHGALNYVDKNLKEDRLTLIGFYRGFKNTKYPLVESSRAGSNGGL